MNASYMYMHGDATNLPACTACCFSGTSSVYTSKAGVPDNNHDDLLVTPSTGKKYKYKSETMLE